VGAADLRSCSQACAASPHIKTLLASTACDGSEQNKHDFSSFSIEQLASKLHTCSPMELHTHLAIIGRVMTGLQRKDLCASLACKAAYTDNRPVLQLLFGEDGAAIELRGSVDAPQTLLCAAYSGSVQTVQWLLQLQCEAPFDADTAVLGYTPLQRACWGDNSAVVAFLCGGVWGGGHELAEADIAGAVDIAARKGSVSCLTVLFQQSYCTPEVREAALSVAVASPAAWGKGGGGPLGVFGLLQLLPDPAGSLPPTIVDGVMKGIVTGLKDKRCQHSPDTILELWDRLLGQLATEQSDQAAMRATLCNGLLEQLSIACHEGNLAALRGLLQVAVRLRHLGAPPMQLAGVTKIAMKSPLWSNEPGASRSPARLHALRALMQHVAPGVELPVTLSPALSGGSCTQHRRAVALFRGGADARVMLSSQRGVLTPQHAALWPPSAALLSHCSALRTACWAGDEAGLHLALGMLFVGAPLAVLPWGRAGLLACVLMQDSVRGSIQGTNARWKEAAAEGGDSPPPARQRMLRLLLSVVGRAAAPASSVQGSEMLRGAWAAARWGGSEIRHGRGALLMFRRALRKGR